ncbi:HxxPF-repeated domain-containing protein [Actinacidiphila yanglinensis]|uniref:HxxPF-repeated domain-containing protein n=1 Tax=Actinacidiphila yanglinensis TaxID=310779 RepID=A0A1H6DFY5_9ACTN|nr:condensation domain-containing protein [Actinacidiphila yanglinensis]SEG84377.1 HxxPF-repeated domain-containing protein [Actinacidiphila yanglinensis]
MTTAERSLRDRAELEQRLLARRARRNPGIPAAGRRPGVNRFPASPVQQLMWEFHHECPGESTWVTLGGVRLFGPLDLALLQRALDALVERHESLRTVFRAGEGGTVEQVVLDRGHRLTLPVLEVSAEQARTAAAAAIDQPFDLVNGPLARLHVLRLAPQEHHLMLVLHHIVSDGHSMEVFIQELSALYLSLAAEVPSPLPPLTVQPADVAAWQRARWDDNTRRRVTGYWQRRLADAEPLRLPTDVQPGPEPSSAGLTCQLPVDEETIDRLRRLGKEHQATLFMVTLAAFHLLFARYSGQRGAMVSTPYSYRDRPETYAPIGAFINYLMLRPDLSGDPAFHTVLEQVRDATLLDFEHHQLPLDELIDALGMDPVEGRRTLMRVLFTEESDPEIPLAPDGELRSEMIADPPWHHALRDLTLRVTAGEDGTHVIVTYRADAFTPQRAADIAADYRDLLRLVAADPGVRVLGAHAALPLRVPVADAPAAATAASEPALEEL